MSINTFDVKHPPGEDEFADDPPPPWVKARDIRDLFSYRLAWLTRINDRQGQTMLLKRFGMPLGEWRTLAAIRVLGHTSLKELAALTQQDVGQLSRYASTLIERGLLVKNTSDTDRRVVEMALTPAGQALHTEVMDFAWHMNRDMFGDLTRDEQVTLVRLLDKLTRSIAARDGSPVDKAIK